MSKSNSEKPSKPYPTFPLFAHATKRWAKKIRGKFHYFGPWSDPEGSLARYNAQAADLHAGREPREENSGGLLVSELCNHFCDTQDHKLELGIIAESTHEDYINTCERIVSFFGREQVVELLQVEDFVRFKRDIGTTLGLRSLGNEINRIRMVFKYGYDEELIDKPIRFGKQFTRPSKRVLRREKQKKGPMMYEPHEIRKLLRMATPPLKAMILLGINCGFGNNDCATLTSKYLDLDTGWHKLPRPKTSIDRRCPLWPETINAIRESMLRNPIPDPTTNPELIFITKYGMPFVRGNENKVSQEFAKIRRAAELGGTFYWLRHTFETIGGESKDQVAVDFIMGHENGSMASEYRERISDKRLQDVTDHIYRWLFPRPTIAV